MDFAAPYKAHTRRILVAEESRERALELAIGAGDPQEFLATGELQRQLLVAHGLRLEDSLVEIGCGSGRLAVQLLGWLRGSYLGLDVVPALLDRAQEIAAGPNMRYQCVNGLTIPTDPGSVDMVCAFSVFTHLRHEESYSYLNDAMRALRPGGRVVFSFLEYRVPSHWHVMEANLDSIGDSGVLNQFMSSDAVEVWAEHLGADLVGLFRGDETFIPLAKPIQLNGHEYRDMGTFGQSVAVYRKPTNA